MNRLLPSFRRARRRAPDDRAQSVVEFALLIPILLIFVVAVIDFGKLFFTYQVITNAAREGARRAALADPAIDPAVVRRSITSALGMVADSADVTFVTEETGGCGAMTGSSLGSWVQVYECGWEGTQADSRVGIEMEYDAALLSSFLSLATGKKFMLRTQMLMRNE